MKLYLYIYDAYTRFDAIDKSMKLKKDGNCDCFFSLFFFLERNFLLHEFVKFILLFFIYFFLFFFSEQKEKNGLPIWLFMKASNVIRDNVGWRKIDAENMENIKTHSE